MSTDYSFITPGSRENYVYLDVYTSPIPSFCNTYGRVPKKTDRLYIKWGAGDPSDLNFDELVTEIGSITRAYEVLYTLICRYNTISVFGNFNVPDLSRLFYWIGKRIPPLTIVTTTIEQAVYFTFCQKFYNGNSFTYCNSCDVNIVTSYDLSVYHTMFEKEAHYNGHNKSYLLQEDIAKYGSAFVKRYATAATKYATKVPTPRLHQVCAPVGVDKSVYTNNLRNFVILDVRALVHKFDSHPEISAVISRILQNIDEYKPRLAGPPTFVEHIISTVKYRALEVFRNDNYIVLSNILARYIPRIVENYNVCVDRIVNIPSYNVYMHDDDMRCYTNQVLYSWCLLDYYSVVEQIEDLNEAMKMVNPDVVYEGGRVINVFNGLSSLCASTPFDMVILANLTSTYIILAIIIVGIVMLLWYTFSKKIEKYVTIINPHRE